MDQLPRLGKRELICLLSFACNYVVFVWRGFLFLWVLGMGYVILLWHSLSLPYNYFTGVFVKDGRYALHFDIIGEIKTIGGGIRVPWTLFLVITAIVKPSIV